MLYTNTHESSHSSSYLIPIEGNRHSGRDSEIASVCDSRKVISKRVQAYGTTYLNEGIELHQVRQLLYPMEDLLMRGPADSIRFEYSL